MRVQGTPRHAAEIQLLQQLADAALVQLKPNWVSRGTYKRSQVAKGLVRRLIITLPPRTLKSLCASVALPAWFLGHYLWKRVVVVSYSDILARNHANDFRRVVNDPLYRATFPTMWLHRDTDREIATTKLGERIATSIDGTLTGLGGNLIIIDDPLKLGDAMSEAVRARVVEWYRSTLLFPVATTIRSMLSPKASPGVANSGVER